MVTQQRNFATGGEAIRSMANATQDCLQRPQLVIASNRSIANPKRKGEGDEEVGPTSCGSKKRMAA